MTKVPEMLKWNEQDIDNWEREYRRSLINSISGYKSANLIGTCDAEGQTNLAIFNSVMHIGANPAYIGIVIRPITVPRHTYNNIKETQYFTINSVQRAFYAKAHQTSANYPSGLSEFEEVGLTACYSDIHTAPYVQESAIKIGLQLTEELPVKSNGTTIIIGKVIELQVLPSLVSDDGFINLSKATIMATNGLDAYCEPKLLNRLQFARPGRQAEPL